MNNYFYNLKVRLIVSIYTPMVPRRFDLPYPAELKTRSEAGGSPKFRQYRGRHLWMATRTDFGRAPLHYATYSLELAKLLLDRGADINMANDLGITPLHLTRDTEVARLLLERGANANAVNNDGKTPGDWAKKYAPRVYDVIKANQRNY